MTRTTDDARFAGSVPDLYDRAMVPMLFEPYALDLTARIERLGPHSVLEVAAGTGALTRAMCDRLGGDVSITATDLHQPMLDRGRSLGTSHPVSWRQADAASLPFDDGTFDVVACQFGVMFFPDRVAAFREIMRVVRPGGAFVFNTWDEIATNEFADTVGVALAGLFPDDPPRFMARTPHGYHDEVAIRADLAAAGAVVDFGFEALEARSRAATSQVAAIGFCQGTPLRGEIEARDPAGLERATAVAAVALADRFGSTDLDGRMRAFVVAVTAA